MLSSGGEQYTYIVNSGQDQKYVEDLAREKQVHCFGNRVEVFVEVCYIGKDILYD